MDYTERIKDLREYHFLTQQKVANQIHVAQRTYADYESGKIRMPIDRLLVLAEYYNVSMDYISGASNIKNEFPKK